MDFDAVVIKMDLYQHDYSQTEQRNRAMEIKYLLKISFQISGAGMDFSVCGIRKPFVWNDDSVHSYQSLHIQINFRYTKYQDVI